MMDQDIPVVIFCGGRGMRLSEKTDSIPKPLVEVGGIPILRHVMNVYAADGFKNFVLCLGYKGEQVREYFVQLADWRRRDCKIHFGEAGRVEYLSMKGVDDWTVTLVDTGEDAETGLRLKRVEACLGDAPLVLATYADGVSDLSVKALLARHRVGGLRGTMTCVRPRTHFGVVEVAPDGRVSRYAEKPQLGERVNGGFFCFNREVFSYLGPNEPLETGLLQRLVRDGQLGAYVYDGYWACMDTFKDYQYLNAAWSRGDAPWRR